MDLPPDAVRLVSEAVYFVVFHFTKAVTALIQRDSFLYWPFAVSSLAIAVLAWRALGRRSWRELRREYFGAALWWHPSARADYRLYLVNAIVVPLLFAFLFADLSQFAARGAPTAETPAWIRALYTLAFFVAYDFGRFAAHCLLHDVPVLWQFHKVHHSAEVLTPLTSYRAHPIELLLMAWGPALATGAVTWLFNSLAAGAVSFYMFMGLHVLIWAFNLVGNLRHSPVWLSYGPRLGRWLISPAHHQLHHSCEPRHWGCNRGFELAIWDRMLGTLYVPPVQPETFRMGLGDGTEASWHSVVRMYLRPFMRPRPATDR